MHDPNVFYSRIHGNHCNIIISIKNQVVDDPIFQMYIIMFNKHPLR